MFELFSGVRGVKVFLCQKLRLKTSNPKLALVIYWLMRLGK